MICSFWLVSCLAKAGEVDRAEALFDQLPATPTISGCLGGDRHDGWRAAGELPAGVQPHRADHGRVGDRPGADAVASVAAGRDPNRLRRDHPGRIWPASTAPVTPASGGLRVASSSTSCSEGSAPLGVHPVEDACRREALRRRARRPAPARPWTAAVKAAEAFAWRDYMVPDYRLRGGGVGRVGGAST